MALLGSGALAIWYDTPATAEHDRWHSREHLQERVGIDGFLRGRRCTSLGAGPRNFMLYEVEHLSTLTSAGYLDRLNYPTSWTQQIVPTIQNMSRTLCRVAADFGQGVGSHAVTVQLSPAPAGDDTLRDWLTDTALPQVAQTAGIVGASLLIGDEAGSRIDTEEKRLRDRRDKIADWIIFIEGYERDAVDRIASDSLSPDALLSNGASGGAEFGRYQLAHVLSECD